MDSSWIQEPVTFPPLGVAAKKIKMIFASQIKQFEEIILQLSWPDISLVHASVFLSFD
jgi:hypothetical protein